VRTRLTSFLEAVTVVDVLPLKCIIAPRRPLRRDVGDISTLAESIKRRGLLEPIIVRPLSSKSKFEIVAGHRRYLACRMSHLSEIRAIVLELSDKEAFGISLEENLQRKTLDPIEEAKCFRSFVQEYGYGSVTELAKIIGKSKEYVSHRIKLLSLPESVQEKVRRRLLTCSDAWEISRIEDGEEQEKVAEAAISNSMTVKQLRMIATLSKKYRGNQGRQKDDDEEEAAGLPIFHKDQESRGSKIKNAASTALRVAMIRIDNLVDSLDEIRDDSLKRKLLDLRLGVHNLVDDFISKKTDSTLDNPSLTHSTGEIEKIRSIIEAYIKSFNLLNISRLAEIRSKRVFSMFDDFPPFNLFGYADSVKHDEKLFRTIDERNYEIEDLRITLLGNGSLALATFFSTDRMRVKDKIYVLRSRVSFVLERTDNQWKIVHEHWSQANPGEDVLNNMRGLEDQVSFASR
jgi:ParB family chromosome partitioning protein